MSERDKGPKPRIKIYLRSPIETIEYYGRDRYVNHDLDELFEDAKNDPLRPEGAHVGWWAFLLKLRTDPWASGKVLIDLPFRFNEDLQPEANLERVFSDVSLMRVEYESTTVFKSYIHQTAKRARDFRVWCPEPDIEAAYSTFDNLVIPHLTQRAQTDISQG